MMAGPTYKKSPYRTVSLLCDHGASHYPSRQESDISLTVLFHKTTTYALLRKAGVQLGKFDFIGVPSKGMTINK